MKLVIRLVAVVAIVLILQPDVAFEEDTTQAEEMQEQMRLMQSQVESIRDAQDPQTRQRLVREHWTTMQRMSEMMEKG